MMREFPANASRGASASFNTFNRLKAAHSSFGHYDISNTEFLTAFDNQ